jgi:hypothetical protein
MINEKVKISIKKRKNKMSGKSDMKFSINKFSLIAPQYTHSRQ